MLGHRDGVLPVRRAGAVDGPTSASWLNLVEVWFSVIERQAGHRGSFARVRELITAIKTFITG